MPLLKHCQGSSLFNYRKILRPSEWRCFTFRVEWQPPLPWSPAWALLMPPSWGHIQTRPPPLHSKTASPGFGLMALFSLHAEAHSSVGSSGNIEFEPRWMNSLDRVWDCHLHMHSHLYLPLAWEHVHGYPSPAAALTPDVKLSDIPKVRRPKGLAVSWAGKTHLCLPGSGADAQRCGYFQEQLMDVGAALAYRYDSIHGAVRMSQICA